jgi:simple sugar transport system permease protein
MVPVAVVVGAAAAVGAALLLAFGVDPLTGYRDLVLGAVGDRYHLSETLVRAVPIALVALGVVPALRARVFTVGSEGQLVVGALASTTVVLALATLPPPLLLVAGALAGAVGGAVWALLPALLLAYARVNEILSTLMLNYVAGFGLLWLLRTALRGPGLTVTPSSSDLPESGRIPTLLSGTRLHWGVVLVLVAAGAAAWWVRSARGFAFDVYGTHPALAARMGVRPAGAVLSTMLIAGAAAGLAGWMQVAGVQGRLYPSVAGGLGFTGLVVALLGRLRPAGVLVVALLFGVLATGAEGLQAGASVPASLVTVLQALLLGGVAVSAAVSHSWLRQSPAAASRAGSGHEGAGQEGRQGTAGEGANDAAEPRGCEPLRRESSG